MPLELNLLLRWRRQINKYILINLLMKLLFLLFFPCCIQAQSYYDGEVVDTKNNQKIAYATIGLIKENTGINADEQGRFQLVSKKIKQDTLIISSVGYETLKIAVDQLPIDGRYLMKDKKKELDNIVVLQTSTKTTLDRFKTCGSSFYLSNGYISEIAKRFTMPVKHAYIDKIEICKSADNAIFRLRIYSMDSISKRPLYDLSDTIIEIKSLRRNVEVDLSAYKIFVPDKDFFVAIEWLKIPYNLSQEKIKMKGVEKVRDKYSPYLSFPYEKYTKGDMPQTENRLWQRNYNGKWMPFDDYWYKADLLIAVSIAY